MSGFEFVFAEGNGMQASQVATLLNVPLERVTDAGTALSLPAEGDSYSVSDVARIRERIEHLEKPK